MAELVFEIWRDDVAGEQSMSQVSEEADKFRSTIMPNAKLAHTFVATSDFDAFQKTMIGTGGAFGDLNQAGPSNCLRNTRRLRSARTLQDAVAANATLIQTARLNFVDPEAWLRDVLSRIAEGHPANRIGELAPWCFSAL